MAAPSSKNLCSSSSCLPVPSRPTNPNSRKSETGNSIRRSFSANPFAKPSIFPIQKGGGGFNPNTPANSPSDYPRRHSVGRESIVVSLRDYEDKENGKDHNRKPAKIKSPASSKGTKNFMSPTISAASKINASPKKKILVERNEPLRTSSSFSEEKGSSVEDFDPKHEKGSTQKKEVSFDSKITYLGDGDALEHDGDFDPEAVSRADDDLNSLSESARLDKDCVNIDTDFDISPKVPCSFPNPDLAPLDADPSLPPYDPQTNYLSPRPRFLRYRPNPRIEFYLNQDRDGKRLEESFTSESLSDTETAEEESESDNSQKTLQEVCDDSQKTLQEVCDDLQKDMADDSAGDSQKDVPDGSAGDTVREQEEVKKEVQKELHASISTSGVKRVSKPPVFSRTKLFALFLVVASACLWVSVNSPVVDPDVINNITFKPYIPHEISDFTRKTFDVLALKFQRLLFHYWSYARDFIISCIQRRKLGPLQYANLTTLLEDGLVDRRTAFDHGISGAEIVLENTVSGIKEEEVDDKWLEEDVCDSIEAGEDIDEAILGDNSDKGSEEHENIVSHNNFEVLDDIPIGVDEKIEEVVQGDDGDEGFVEQEDIVTSKSLELSEEGAVSDSEDLNINQQAEEGAISETEELNISEQDVKTKPGNSATEMSQQQEETVASVVELQSNIFHEDQQFQIPQAEETQIEASDFQHNDMNFPGIESNTAESNPHSTESTNLPLKLKNPFSSQTMMEISFLIFSLLAAIAFIHVKYRTRPTSNAALSVDHIPLAKKLDYNTIAVTAEQKFQKRPSSQNWQTEVDMVEESPCPSEMSSFQNSLSHSKKRVTGTSEAQSLERKTRKNYRRESMASSSDYSRESQSPSYGSFTTYEKIPSKHGNEEEEVFTPVRRSSRIRNQVTSP